MQAQPATPRPSPIRWLRALLATLALATLAACTQTLDTDVTRFAAQLPHPAGQSFTVVAGDPALAGGIEFGQYAALVSAQLAKQGYTPSPDPASAALVVRLDYGVDKGRTVVTSSPAPFWGPWHGYHGFGGYGGLGGAADALETRLRRGVSRVAPEELLPLPALRKYVAFARRNCSPQLLPEAGLVLKSFYKELRARHGHLRARGQRA